MAWEIIEEMTDADLAFNIAGLPGAAREELKAGPWPEPHCGVCRAMDKVEKTWAPAIALLDYHDTPFRRHHDTRDYREGKEVYARCLRIYRAAGWPG